MKKRIFLAIALTFACSIGCFLPKQSAKASSNVEVLSESQIDELFIEQAVNLGSWDSVNNCFQTGTATDYLCKKNNAGVVIKAGFQPLTAGTNISGKTIYIFNVNGQIGDFANTVSSANYEYQLFTSVGDYAVFAMGTAPIVQSTLLTGSTYYHKIKVPNEVSIIKNVEPYLTKGCSLFYTYEKIPQVSNYENESSLESSLDSSSWLSENWLPIVLVIGAFTLCAAFLIVVKHL